MRTSHRIWFINSAGWAVGAYLLVLGTGFPANLPLPGPALARSASASDDGKIGEAKLEALAGARLAETLGAAHTVSGGPFTPAYEVQGHPVAMGDLERVSVRHETAVDRVLVDGQIHQFPRKTDLWIGVWSRGGVLADGWEHPVRIDVVAIVEAGTWKLLAANIKASDLAATPPPAGKGLIESHCDPSGVCVQYFVE